MKLLHCTDLEVLKAKFLSGGVNFEQETKRSNLAISNSNRFGECILIDDEHKSMEDQPVPMSLEQTEPMHSELDQMVLLFFASLFIFFLSLRSVSKLNW